MATRTKEAFKKRDLISEKIAIIPIRAMMTDWTTVGGIYGVVWKHVFMCTLMRNGHMFEWQHGADRRVWHWNDSMVQGDSPTWCNPEIHRQSAFLCAVESGQMPTTPPLFVATQKHRNNDRSNKTYINIIHRQVAASLPLQEYVEPYRSDLGNLTWHASAFE